MLRVRVDINSETMIDICVTRREDFVSVDTVHEYDAGILEWSKGQVKEMQMGRIRHKYSAGAAELAIKLLHMYKLVKAK